MHKENEPILPFLREDLHLQKGMSAEDGAPTWMIYDALRNRYFKIGKEAFDALSLWQPGITIGDFVKYAHEVNPFVKEEDVNELVKFLRLNQLVDASSSSQMELLKQTYKTSQKSLWSWLIHNYLFIRIPLFRPDGFLKKTWPFVRHFYEDRSLKFIRLLGVIGIFFAMQQWDHFLATFLYFFSWQGLLIYFVTLVVVKSAHELSHAYVAYRHGCKVASIGVAFLVLFPVLYTDVTDAWKLRQRQQKLSITLAGMAAELHIALIATFLWALLPEGVMRSGMFFLATTSWITSLMVNINPFMRFDGYFALSDITNIENLQPRSFAIARWKLREWVFGFKDQPPETLSQEKIRFLTLYAFGTWIYRLILFIGIAVLVYYFAFKMLGIILFLVEIIYFVAKPVFAELKEWVKRKDQVTWNINTKITAAISLILMSWLLLPWKNTVIAPAILEVSRYAEIFPSRSARIERLLVGKGDIVGKGDLLVELVDNDLEAEISQKERSLALTQSQLMRLAGSAEALDYRLVLEQKKKQQEKSLQGLIDARSRLQVVSPVSGIVSFMENVSEGQYVNKDSLLVGIRSNNTGVRIVGYLSENDLSQVVEGAEVTWIPSLIERPSFKGVLSVVDKAASVSLPYIELSSDYGGDIATRPISATGGNIFRPESAIYRIEVASGSDAYMPAQREVGVVHVESGWHSPLYSFYNRVVVTAIKEAVF